MSRPYGLLRNLAQLKKDLSSGALPARAALRQFSSRILRGLDVYSPPVVLPMSVPGFPALKSLEVRHLFHGRTDMVFTQANVMHSREMEHVPEEVVEAAARYLADSYAPAQDARPMPMPAPAQMRLFG